MQETHSSTLAQYLEEIQRENFRENYSSIVELASMNSTVNMLISSQEDLLPERVEARAKLKEESLRQTIRNTVARFPSDEGYPVPLWSIDLWGELMGALSAEQNSALPNTQRTVLYGREANGWTIFHPDGRILAIDIALDPVFFYMNQAAYLAKQRAERDNGLSEEFFRAVLAPYLLYFVALPPPASLPATRGMTKAAYLLLKSTTRDQLRFVAAHEIGHALLGHSWGDRRPAGPPGSTADAEEAAQGRDMEYAADGFALDLVTGLCLKNSQLDQIHAAGAETEDQKNRLAEELIRTMDPLSLSLHLLFVFLESFERTADYLRSVLDETPGAPAFVMHPPAGARIGRLCANGLWELSQPDAHFVGFTRHVMVEVWMRYLKSLSSAQIRTLLKEVRFKQP